jgi:uncharacterized protein (TIGR00730 family)
MTNDNEFSVHGIKKNAEGHVKQVSQELRAGLNILKKYQKSVTVFGSSRSNANNPHYKDAEDLGYRIAEELQYAVITGGGPGIMTAANRGAKRAGGNSIAITIKLPHEQQTNPYVTEAIDCEYFMTRKSLLNFSAESYVFFPGGYGTLDELFGVLTLIQTNKIPKVPIILIGKDFWNPLKNFLIENVVNVHHTIDAKDIELFTVTDNIDKAIEIIKNAPVSKWWLQLD